MRIIIENDNGLSSASTPVISTTNQSQGSLASPVVVNAGAARAANGSAHNESPALAAVSAPGGAVNAGQAPAMPASKA